MAVKDHGFWIEYTPVIVPEDVPRGVVFLKRESDGFDWYEYVNVEEARMEAQHKGRVKQFQPATVKCVLDVKGRGDTTEPIVRVAAVDETRLFPHDGQVIELLDETREQDEKALIEEFCNRTIDLKTGRLGQLWTPPKGVDKIGPVLEKILERLEKLEGKLNG